MSLEEDEKATRNLLAVGFNELIPFRRTENVGFEISEFSYPESHRPCLVVSIPPTQSVVVLYDLQRGFYRLVSEIGRSHAGRIMADIHPPLNVGLYCRGYVRAEWTPSMKGALPRLSILETYGSGRAANELRKRPPNTTLVGIEITTSPPPVLAWNTEAGEYTEALP